MKAWETIKDSSFKTHIIESSLDDKEKQLTRIEAEVKLLFSKSKIASEKGLAFKDLGVYEMLSLLHQSSSNKQSDSLEEELKNFIAMNGKSKELEFTLKKTSNEKNSDAIIETVLLYLRASILLRKLSMTNSSDEVKKIVKNTILHLEKRTLMTMTTTDASELFRSTISKFNETISSFLAILSSKQRANVKTVVFEMPVLL